MLGHVGVDLSLARAAAHRHSAKSRPEKLAPAGIGLRGRLEDQHDSLHRSTVAHVRRGCHRSRRGRSHGCKIVHSSQRDHGAGRVTGPAFPALENASPFARRCARPAREEGRPARARPVGVLDDVGPALRRKSICAHDEAIGKLHDQRTPLGRACRNGACSLRNARSHHKLLVLPQHRASCSGRSKPACAHRMRACGPAANSRPMASASECGMQNQLVLSASSTRRVGPADRHPRRNRWNSPRPRSGARRKSFFEEADDASSRVQVTESPRVRYGRSEGRNDVGRVRPDAGAFVVRTRHQRALQARLARPLRPPSPASRPASWL